MVPFLVLGAFAGIRHAEVQRLEWKDVRFDARDDRGVRHPSLTPLPARRGAQTFPRHLPAFEVCPPGSGRRRRKNRSGSLSPGGALRHPDRTARAAFVEAKMRVNVDIGRQGQ
jgi:integrase